jgi:hypothetical protein
MIQYSCDIMREWITKIQRFHPFRFEMNATIINIASIWPICISILEWSIPNQFCQSITSNSILLKKSRILRIEDSDTLLLSQLITIAAYYYQNIKISYQSYYQYSILSKLSTFHINKRIILVISVKVKYHYSCQYLISEIICVNKVSCW